jgi:hypothetical protein
MKTRFFLLVILIVCFSSCGTNNKPLSDAQKEKIKGEAKEVMNIVFKAAEEANSDMILGVCLNSPDFAATFDGMSFDYKQFAEAVKPIFSTLINQKGTIVEEKYAVLDNLTVLYTAKSKWLMNYKDGHSVLQDPWAMQYLLKKIGNEWKVISANESGIEKSAPGENSRQLNHVELMNQLKGTWQSNAGKDTIEVWNCENYGKAFVANVYQIIKGKKTPIYINNTSFDSKEGDFKGFTLWSNGDYGTWIGLFTNEKVLSGNFIWDFHANMPWGKFQIEFKKPKEFILNYFNTDGVKTSEMTFKKVK